MSEPARFAGMCAWCDEIKTCRLIAGKNVCDFCAGEMWHQCESCEEHGPDVDYEEVLCRGCADDQEYASSGDCYRLQGHWVFDEHGKLVDGGKDSATAHLSRGEQ